MTVTGKICAFFCVCKFIFMNVRDFKLQILLVYNIYTIKIYQSKLKTKKDETVYKDSNKKTKNI